MLPLLPGRRRPALGRPGSCAHAAGTRGPRSSGPDPASKINHLPAGCKPLVLVRPTVNGDPPHVAGGSSAPVYGWGRHGEHS